MKDLEFPRDDSGSHIPELQTWAQSQKDRLQTRKPLSDPFVLAIETIRHKARDRPTIDKVEEVFTDPAVAVKEYFCHPCLQEVEELRVERGRHSNRFIKTSVPAQIKWGYLLVKITDKAA